MTSHLSTWIVRSGDGDWVHRNCLFTLDPNGLLRFESVGEDGYLVVAVYAPGQWAYLREKEKPNG